MTKPRDERAGRRERVKHLALGAVIILALLAFCACRAPPDSGAAATTLTIGVRDGRPFGLIGSCPACRLLFLPLVRFAADGSIEGVLASHWTAEGEGTYRVRLRPDVRWHDGAPLTSHDVAFTFDLLSHPDVLQLSPEAARVTIVDDLTFRVTYRRDVGSPDSYYTVYPKHLLEALDPAAIQDWAFWDRPVGSGPYRHVRTVAHTATELEANPDFYAGPPAVHRVILKFGAANLTELRAGAIDALQNVPWADVVTLDSLRFRVYHSYDPWPAVSIVWNHRHPALADPAVRRALTMAIDRRNLIHALNLPAATPIVDVLLGDPRDLHPDTLPPPVPYDPAAAAALLDRAGWRDADGDGVRERNSVRLTLSGAINRWQQSDRAAVFVQDALRRVGVNVELAFHPRPRGELLANRVDFVVGFLGNHALVAASDSGIGYDRPELFRVLLEAHEKMYTPRSRALYRDAWPVLQQDLPVTVLYPIVWNWVTDRRLRGLESPHRTDLIEYIDLVKVDEES